MPITNEGGINSVLAYPGLVTPPTFAPFDPGKPAHSWQDTAAVGKTGTLYYPFFGGMPPDTTSLTELPTFGVAAADAAAANWPPRIAQIGNQSYPADASGNVAVGAQPMNILPTPLRQPWPGEAVQLLPPEMVPCVFLTTTAIGSLVLPPSGVPGPEFWQGVADALNRLLAKTGA